MSFYDALNFVFSELAKWRADFMVSIGDAAEAISSYSVAKDYLNVAKIYCKIGRVDLVRKYFTFLVGVSFVLLSVYRGDLFLRLTILLCLKSYRFKSF